jgi:glyoxylase-like metal-dependent hydrolase (beta-lactamase superfamily II)
MSTPQTMIGLDLPDIDVWSDRVVVALCQNPSLFTGPGTNSYLIGTGAERILLDPGGGKDAYLPVLEQALERTGARIQEIVCTHGHPDHLGGVASIVERFGALQVSKLPWPGNDESQWSDITPLADGCVVQTEGATLRGVHAPGHAPDHLCFVLEEERAMFTGDNVLGVGTTVIPATSGDLVDYMNSLDRLLAEEPTALYPAHGPLIPDGVAKIREYIDHRIEREAQILSAVADGLDRIPAMVKRIYAKYPDSLHAAAGSSVAAHLMKLRREQRVDRDGDEPLAARWTLR